MSEERFKAFMESHEIIPPAGVTPLPMFHEHDMKAAYFAGLKDARDGMASKLIDTWSATRGGKPVPWKIAVAIVAVIGNLPKEEENRLLALDN